MANRLKRQLQAEEAAAEAAAVGESEAAFAVASAATRTFPLQDKSRGTFQGRIEAGPDSGARSQLSPPKRMGLAEFLARGNDWSRTGSHSISVTSGKDLPSGRSKLSAAAFAGSTSRFGQGVESAPLSLTLSGSLWLSLA